MATVRKIHCAVTGKRWREGDKGWYVVRQGDKRAFWCCEPFDGGLLLRGWKIVKGLGAASALLARWGEGLESKPR